MTEAQEKLESTIAKVNAEFGNDPLYTDVVTAISKEDQQKKIELLRDIRGAEAYNRLLFFLRKQRSKAPLPLAKKA